MHHVRFQFHLLFTSVYTTFLPPFRRSGCGESPRIVSTRGGEPAPASVHGTIAIDAARSSSTSSTWSAPAADALWISGSPCRGGTRSRSGSIQNFLDIPHSVQHAHDLNRLGDGIVDDQIGVDGPEFQGTASEILANMSRAWFVTEKLQGPADILQNPARDHRASLLHQEDLYLV